MPDIIDEIVREYIDVFNETDQSERRTRLGNLFASDATYTDPHVDLCGPEQIEAFIAATQERVPGFRFTLGGDIDAHHNQARFNWYAGPSEVADPQYVGFDVLVTDGVRVRSVYGFMDAAAA
jgi:hypothetical protein